MPRIYEKWPKFPCEFCGQLYAHPMHARNCKKNPERERVVPYRLSHSPQAASTMSLNVSIRLDIEELAELPPAKVEAIMQGVAKVLIAQGG